MSSFTPSLDDLYGLALHVARVAHTGQIRRGNGEPYIKHVMRVAWNVDRRRSSQFESPIGGMRSAIVAFLHDTIEDTPITAGTLRTIGFPQDIVEDVLALTRGENEEYGHYIHRLLEWGSDDALAVKSADLADNLRSLDEIRDPQKEAELRQRYDMAVNLVTHELERRRSSAAKAA